MRGGGGGWPSLARSQCECYSFRSYRNFQNGFASNQVIDVWRRGMCGGGDCDSVDVRQMGCSVLCTVNVTVYSCFCINPPTPKMVSTKIRLYCTYAGMYSTSTWYSLVVDKQLSLRTQGTNVCFYERNIFCKYTQYFSGIFLLTHFQSPPSKH